MKTGIYRNLIVCVLISLLFSASGCKTHETKETGNPAIVDKALSDTSSRFYANFEEYPTDLKQLPIGVFDSGTGGLTVLEKLLELDQFDNIDGSARPDNILDFAGERFLYLADQANMPYGNYDKEGKSDYLVELAVKDALFLMGDRYYKNAYESNPSMEKPRVKILVIACNTATAYGLSTIQSMLRQSGTGVKVIGVINAGVKATIEKLKIDNDSDATAIGVLATPGTIASGAYERTIFEELANMGITSHVEVINQSGYGFAEAVDAEPDYVNPDLTSPRESYRGPRIGEADDNIKLNLLKAYNFDMSANRTLVSGSKGNYSEIQLNCAEDYARFNLVSLVERHRQSGSIVPIRAIILGCTHYPFHVETLKRHIDELREYREPDGTFPYRNLLAEDIQFIDPAVNTAIECYETLRADENLAFRISQHSVDAYISVASSTLSDSQLSPDGHLSYEFKYGRQTGTEDVSTKQVPFSLSNIDPANLQRIEKTLPYCYSLIAPNLK